jgi:hypothetical protein
MISLLIIDVLLPPFVERSDNIRTRASLECNSTTHMLGTTWRGLNNSQGHDILEGESPLSAVPTAMLFRIRAWGV